MAGKGNNAAGSQGKNAADKKKAGKTPAKTRAWSEFMEHSRKDESFWETLFLPSLKGITQAKVMCHVIGEVIIGVGDILRANMLHLERIRLEAEDDAIGIGFKVKVSFKDETPKVSVSCSYSQTFKDSRDVTLPDPNQPELDMEEDGKTE